MSSSEWRTIKKSGLRIILIDFYLHLSVSSEKMHFESKRIFKNSSFNIET